MIFATEIATTCAPFVGCDDGSKGRLQYHEMGRESIGGIGSNLFTVAIPGFGLFTDKLQDLRPSTAESAS